MAGLLTAWGIKNPFMQICMLFQHVAYLECTLQAIHGKLVKATRHGYPPQFSLKLIKQL